MRSYSALALLSALITVCLGAQSDRSRQRSSPVRSVPVAADIKRDADFDCPEEFGYYPHPTDCTLYYVCVFGGALLESCTGGLMYSHELQTCDWPRNVGCDGASVISGDELERLNEREPPRRKSTSPRRTPPPPPPRAQPNPVITSRGQPKYNREQYEKQQQLYAEVDDLPPVEEIESDRQQRVYRGQPSTIGQVQKDRDGYVSQPANSGRNLNSNIIPASLSQSSKFGSFSFGSQVDDRRTATVTPVPQSYSDDRVYVTDFHHDKHLDIEMNVIDRINNDLTKKQSLRRKREVTGREIVGTTETLTRKNSKRRDTDTDIEYIELDPKTVEMNSYEMIHDEIERGKRQVRYFLKNGHSGSGKNWLDTKNNNANNYHQVRYNPSIQNIRYQPIYTDSYNTNYFATENRPTSFENNANTFSSYRPDSQQTEKQFKPSQSDPSYSNYVHSTRNIATQVVTKSPPISSLKNNDNLFHSLAGGFYNNSPRPANYNSQLSSEVAFPETRPSNQILFPDSSLLPSTIVTGKPVIMSTSIPTINSYRSNSNQINNNASPPTIPFKSGKLNQNPRPKDEDYDNEDSLEYEESSSDEDDDSDSQYQSYFPKPPYEFTHPSNKYANIENPFANPDFDFDSFLSKLSNGEYTPRPKIVKELSTPSNIGITLQGSKLNYKGMSTPKPFTGSGAFVSTLRPNDSNVIPHAIIKQSQLYSQFEQPQPSQLPYYHQQQSLNQNGKIKLFQQTAGTSLDAIRPKLKPPNFKDDRELPLTYSFTTIKPKYNETKYREENQQTYLVTQKPYIIVTSTGTPIILSSPKYQHIVNPEKILTFQPHVIATSKPYITSSVKPFIHQTFQQSTPKPLTTIANYQLSALQNYWQNPSTVKAISQSVTPQPTAAVDYAKLGSLFAQAVRSSTQVPIKNHNVFNNELKNLLTTTKSPPKRRPIPKPSPEMNDYYYDDEDDQYYYEPIVKPKYMPSTEVRPQRPPMAQNYKEYEDNYEVFQDQKNSNVKPSQLISNTEIKYNSYKPISDTKKYNNVSVVTKSPVKDTSKNTSGKILVPVLVEYASVRPSVLIRPEVSNYEIVHQNLQNRTMQHKKPSNFEAGPYTTKPPKYLNQTILRPYTVRHRLAKPNTVSVKNPALKNNDPQNKGRTRHQNIVAQMKLSIPKDSYNQETRYSKTKHDDKTNSLEPTENVAPVSYSPSPRPKMLYNGSQSYIPDQYDPFYAVYDEDGELYKDADYVQQYNVASLRPAVQQTYRGTPPPSKRPTENYTRRPVVNDDYDDALIQGQISNQNQYQSPVRHPARGEGNELGYEHNPSSVRTTLYEATSISTIPTTSSTSTTTTTTTTTTQRSTTAQFTEAMTPSRYSPRLSTNEKPSPKPKSSTNPPVIDPISLAPSTASSIVNFSSLAKPFEKTDNSYRLQSTLPTFENKLTSRHPSIVTNNNKLSVETTQPVSSRGKKKILSLTSGFSIRRNMNDTNNPYTLTVLTRPVDDYNQLVKTQDRDISISQQNSGKYDHNSGSRNVKKSLSNSSSNSDDYLKFESTSEKAFTIKDTVTRIDDDNDIPIYTRPVSRSRGSTKPTVEMTSPLPVTTTVVSTTPMPRTTPKSFITKTIPPITKYYIKISKRPTPFTSDKEEKSYSTENVINTETLIEKAQENEYDNSINSNRTSTEESFEWREQDRDHNILNNPTVSPYRTLDNLRKTYKNDFVQDYTTSTIATTPFTAPFTFTRKTKSKHNTQKHTTSRSDLSYYSYHVEDDVIPDQTTEIFRGKVKHVIQAFFNNLITTPTQLSNQEYSSTTPVSTKVADNEKIVNMGFRKQTFKGNDYKTLQDQAMQSKDVQESTIKSIEIPNFDIVELPIIDSNIYENSSPFTLTIPVTNTPTLTSTVIPQNIQTRVDNSKGVSHNLQIKDVSTSKFSDLIKGVPEQVFEDVTVGKVQSRFQNLSNAEQTTEPIIQENISSDIPSSTKYIVEAVTPLSLDKSQTTIGEPIDIASTTSTTKSTTTEILESTTKTTTTTSKSISFPTRPSRVNPAIKLAATNIGSGRRSYQSPSKCSTDNSLQANPKCNEIKYQRPTTTRGRGSAHYSKSGGSDAQQPTPNRGTPPTRSRPTLKPSTAIVSKSTEFIDIYAHPPSRPAPVYPQPTLDKTAAKCRKDVCLLPDCYCGGKDIPGDLPVESVPQIVLLTFDDSVNDLNKGLYADLFEKGRVNPNGCPISATFYVSHEWTDYSQVQNLYSAGHEMASHTISHSFGEQFSQKKWNREVAGQRELLAAYGGVKLEDVRGMRAPFLSVGGNKMFKMLYDSNFTYDSSLPVYENRPPSWPYTLDYKLFHDCMIPPCPTKSYPGVWEVPMVMWQDLNGGRCSMGDACANPPEAENVYKMILKNFDRHYTTNRAPFGLFYHAAWFTQPHHKEGFIMFLDFINQMPDVWIVTNWQALQWVRDPTPISRLNNFQPFQCNYQDRPKKCNNPKVCNLWHKSGVRYMRTCQPCPEIYPWTGKSGIRSSRIDNDNGE